MFELTAAGAGPYSSSTDGEDLRITISRGGSPLTPRSIPFSLVMVVALVGVVIAQPKHTPPKTAK